MHHIKITQSLIVLLALLGSFLGCSPPKAPTLTPEVTRVTAVTTQGITIQLTLATFNPNSFDLATQKVTGTITLGEKVTLGPLTTPHAVRLTAGKSTSVTLDMNATWSQAADLAQLALAGTEVPYQVQGTVAIGGPKLNVDLPFKIKGQVSQTQIIAAGLKGLPSIPGLPSLR